MTEETLFHLAQQQPDPTARIAFLDRVCVNQPELRARLERLLQAGDAPASFLNRPAVPPEAPPSPPTGAFQDRDDQGQVFLKEAVGNQIGHYKLLQKLGEGGMGA